MKITGSKLQWCRVLAHQGFLSFQEFLHFRHLNVAGHRRILPYHHGVKLLVEKAVNILRCAQEKQLSSHPHLLKSSKITKLLKFGGYSLSSLSSSYIVLLFEKGLL